MDELAAGVGENDGAAADIADGEAGDPLTAPDRLGGGAVDLAHGEIIAMLADDGADERDREWRRRRARVRAHGARRRHPSAARWP